MSPWGGRFRNYNALCTLTSETTSAQIYYTLDNSTPTNTNGTLYTGPFEVDTTEESITVKAVAYDYNCSTPLSLVISGEFHRYGYRPRDDWYDDRGILVEAHSGHILQALGKYWWYGSLMNTHSNGDNTANFGVFLYSSTDMYNWKFEGHILDAINEGIDFTGTRIIRMHVIYNASTQKYVLWSHEQFPSDAAGIATADHPAGPWTWVNIGYLPGGRGYKDCNLFQDDDGTAYTVFTNETQTNMNIFQLSSDYLTATGGGILVNAGLGREGHAPFKRNGVYFMINSRGNYYDSNGLTFDLKYQTSTTGMLGTWSALSAAFPAPSETLGTDYNVQPTQVIKVGKSWMLIADYWVGGPDDNPPTNQLYHSRQVWLPITFPTSTTLEIGRPAEWGYEFDRVGLMGGGIGSGIII
jgi:beta-galactosidase